MFLFVCQLFARASIAGQVVSTEATPAPLPATAEDARVALPFAIDGPPPPLFPAVISRDESGRATIRAVRLAAPLRLDGKLDEPHYASVPPMVDFVQMEPQYGSAATEKTELWLAFDHDQVYVSFRCWETQMDRIVANEMRRDGSGTWQGNDIVSFIFDTFYDRRNGVEFTVNAIGGRSDGQVTSERQYNGDWNPIWEVKTGRFEGGWTVEAAVPFKSLRYRPGQAQVWGFNTFRTNRWKNELSFLSRPTAGRGQSGLSQVSMAATVVGLEAPSGAKNLEIKPYVTSNLTTDLNAAPPVTNKAGADLGLDLKYGVTQNLTADFTYRTDFAQVEADEQQINLTRFSLQFPEKREFFLENRGTFQFGGAGQGNFASGGGGGGGSSSGGTFGGAGGSGSDTPQLFYSRRIGLDESGKTPILVPIVGGARLTGRVGRHGLGLMNIRTDDQPVSGARPTSFSVVRVNRDIWRKSTVGAMATARSVGRNGVGTNEAYGIDGAFGFFDNLSINTYWARTRTSGLEGDDTSYRAQLDYSSDQYGVQLEQLAVGDNFNPEIGFVRRKDMRRSFAQFRFSPRPMAIAAVRKFFGRGSVEHITNGAGRLETRTYGGEFAIEFQNSDRFTVTQDQTYEYLKDPFPISSTVVPVGSYAFTNNRVSFTLGQQRKLSGTLSAEFGTFYDGDKKTISASRGRLNLSPRLSVEPTFSMNWIDFQEGSFTTNLFGSRVTYTMTPEMFASALLQYTSNQGVMANVRLRWEYRPGSELFVVYNEQRDTSARAFPDLTGRALIVKVNRLFRF